jgi:hypothetical protein
MVRGFTKWILSVICLKRLLLQNVLNIDIEDVAQDEHQNFYLADIGNNSNNRRNLRIYKISNPNNAANDSVTGRNNTYCLS